MRNLKSSVLVLGIFGVALVGQGCGSLGAVPGGRDSAIRANLTPELATLTDRPVDLSNEYALMANENSRMILSDLSRAWYTDRPSRLSKTPLPR